MQLMTKDQEVALVGGFEALGLFTRDDRLAFVREVCGDGFTALTPLTVEDAEDLILELRKRLHVAPAW